MVAIQHSWALRCLEGGVATTPFNIDTARNTSHTTYVGPIRVIDSDQAAGKMLWQSPTYSTTLTCYDDYQTNRPEYLYLYPDDQYSQLTAAFANSNLIVGIKYEGREYEIHNNYAAIATGQLALISTSSTAAKNNCKLIGKPTTSSCATPQTVTIQYSLFIKSRGSGKKYNAGTRNFTMFQVDGAGGRNRNGNFQELISNIQVNYIDCVPIFNVQDVNLGRYSPDEPINKILRRTPFTLEMNMTGKDCASSVFTGRWSSNQMLNNTTLTAAETNLRNRVGIRIFDTNKTTPIAFDQDINFVKPQGNSIRQNYDAGVLFLSKPPAGKFTSTLNYEVWLK